MAVVRMVGVVGTYYLGGDGGERRGRGRRTEAENFGLGSITDRSRSNSNIRGSDALAA